VHSLVLIDSSTWILAIRGTPPGAEIVDQLLAARRAVTNRVIVAELLIRTKTAQEYRQFSDDLAVLPHLELTEPVWAESARIGFELRRKGVTAALPDLIIAACASTHECELLSDDQDFDLIARHAPLKLYKPARAL
jgi:predicted nucleic acid-binding protein